MSILRSTALAILPLLAGAAFAQAPAPQPQQPPAVTIPGVSAAGNATLTRLQRQPDPMLKLLATQMSATGQELQLALQRPVINVDEIAMLLKKSETLQTQLHTKSNDRIVAALRALPASDRAPFLRAIGSGQRAPAPAK